MVTKKQAEAFIGQIANDVVILCKKYGIAYPSAVIAHACNEGKYGQSSLAKNYNNLFGMKISSSWKGKKVRLKTKEEYKKGVLTPIYAYFKVFENYSESIEDYLKLVTGSYYTKRCKLKESASYADYIDRLMPVYCTSSTQASTLKNIVKDYNLTRYDEASGINRVLKEGCKGEDVRLLQEKLNEKGYNLKTDGIFGQITKGTVMDFQKKNNLTVDGIVGKQTLKALNKETG